MKLSAEEIRNGRKTALQTAVVLVLLLGIIYLVWRFADYTGAQLYEESRSQMGEIMEQSYEKLGVVLDEQWDYIATLETLLREASPQTDDELAELLRDAQRYLGAVDDSFRFIAVDREGYYYDENGREGIWDGAAALDGSVQKQSFITSMFNESGNRMAFAHHMTQPQPIRSKNHASELTDIVLLKTMDSLTPYFRCSAFSDRNITYVLRSSGVKMYSDNTSEDTVFAGRNIYYALRELEFPHMGDFDACLAELDRTGYVCTDVRAGDNVYFLSLRQLPGYSWTLLFMVDEDYVAASTTEMVNSIIRIFTFTLIVLLGAVYLGIYSISKARQEQERYELGVKNAAALSAANRDLEKARKNEQRARQTAEEALHIAKSANKAKTEFLANMSHDIRTPMNAIVGIAGLMEHEVDDPDRLQGYIHKIQSSSRHLLGLINDILDMSKIESSEVSLHMEPLELASQIGQLDSIIRPQALARQQEFSIRIHKIRHEYVIGDGMRLRQVLINILSNAVKYTPEGGKIELAVSELPCSSKTHARFSFAVTDNGIGMSEELVAHLYEPFVRGEASVTNKIQGTGLGMAITKNIVDMMGGAIHVESKPGHGTRFEVVLEFKRNPDAVRSIERLDVLLLSREALLIENVGAALSQTGSGFRHAADADEAVRLAEQEAFDVVLLSGQPYGEELTALAHRLRAASHTPLHIFCLDYARAEEMQAHLDENGVDGRIPRPFFLSNLESELDRVRHRADEKDEGTSVLNGMRFLCAEDNALNAEILQALLEMSGASCVICEDGREIVERFAAVKPGEFDVVLMDIQMPHMDGYEATRAIRKGSNPVGHTIPIVAMTANAFSDDIQHSIDAGMDAHISKPVDMKMVERTMREFLCDTPGPDGRRVFRSRRNEHR